MTPGTYLPELLGSILAGNALQDLRAAGVLVHEAGDVVDGRVDDNVQALLGVVVGGDFGRGEGLGRHGGWCVVGVVGWLYFGGGGGDLGKTEEKWNVTFKGRPAETRRSRESLGGKGKVSGAEVNRGVPRSAQLRMCRC